MWNKIRKLFNKPKSAKSIVPMNDWQFYMIQASENSISGNNFAKDTASIVVVLCELIRRSEEECQIILSRKDIELFKTKEINNLLFHERSRVVFAIENVLDDIFQKMFPPCPHYQPKTIGIKTNDGSPVGTSFIVSGNATITIVDEFGSRDGRVAIYNFNDPEAIRMKNIFKSLLS